MVPVSAHWARSKLMWHVWLHIVNYGSRSTENDKEALWNQTKMLWYILSIQMITEQFVSCLLYGI